MRTHAWLMAAAVIAVLGAAFSLRSHDFGPAPGSEGSSRLVHRPALRPTPSSWERTAAQGAAEAPAIEPVPDAAGALPDWRRWAEQDPEAALAAARARHDELRLARIIAVLEGAAKQPEVALRLARRLLELEPEQSADWGTALVGALVRNDAFATALDFVRQGPAEQRATWLSLLFSAWAEREPAIAAELGRAYAAQGIQGGAFESLFQHWANASPGEAARCAATLPAGAARETALRLTVRAWVVQDPTAVAAALPQFAVPAEHDLVAADLVCATDAANRPTAQALVWAESIGDATLRQRALTHVVREWSQQNAAAAGNYVATSPQLTPAERDALQRALVAATTAPPDS